MRPNRLRQLLRTGPPSLGTHLAISGPSIVELVGHSQMLDHVEFVAESHQGDSHHSDPPAARAPR